MSGHGPGAAPSAPADRRAYPLRLEVRESGIAFLTLDRPDRYNALSGHLLEAMLDALTQLGTDRSVRVVVLGGAGKAFSAGHDLAEMRGLADSAAVRQLFRLCADVMLAMIRLPQPIIARVHGIATAAGCQLVANADLAVAASSARFAVSGVNLGLFCSTPMVALSRNLGRKRAMEMLLTGEFIDADTALQVGLVNRVVAPEELDDAVLAMARAVAGKSPVAVSLGKALFYRQLESTVEEAYAAAVQTMTCNMMTEDAGAGIDAFLAKRPAPEWTGR